MKITIADSMAYVWNSDKGIEAELLDSSVFINKEEGWEISHYSYERQLAGVVQFERKDVPVFSDGDNNYFYNHKEAGHLNFAPNLFLGVMGNGSTFYYQGSDDLRVVAKSPEGTLKRSDETLKNTFINNNYLYALPWDTPVVKKFDSDLGKVWAANIEGKVGSGSLAPVMSGGLVIFSAGNQSRRREKPKSLVGCIQDSDGSSLWVKEISALVTDYLIESNRLWVASLSGLEIIDVSSGEVLSAIGMEFDPQNTRRVDKATISTYGGYIFYCHQPLLKMFIFDKSNFALVKEIEVPEGIQPGQLLTVDESSENLYFYGYQRGKEVGNAFLLELDPNNLDAPIEFEPTPDISSRFVATEDTPEQCELHIDITTESLDDAIRFGEITVRKLAMQHSLSLLRSGPCLAEQGLKPDERFNGTIRLVLHDVQGDTAQIDEYLATLKQRVDEWAAGFDTLVGWFKNPDTGGYIRTQVFPRRAGQPEQVRILPKGNPFAEHELDDFVSDLESDTLKLDNKHYVARLTELTETITSEQSSPQDMATATYFKGTLAYMNNDEQAAL
ncbi:hypothetical protein MHM93_19255, partial [Pseudoalteromonas sp. MM17-2]|uniref:hypothetical protein n=1 Tax=Pseudoalteromonas sp. MM17-2 TaxID=2917753 RepID=UPI001EF5066E